MIVSIERLTTAIEVAREWRNPELCSELASAISWGPLDLFAWYDTSIIMYRWLEDPAFAAKLYGRIIGESTLDEIRVLAINRRKSYPLSNARLEMIRGLAKYVCQDQPVGFSELTILMGHLVEVVLNHEEEYVPGSEIRDAATAVEKYLRLCGLIKEVRHTCLQLVRCVEATEPELLFELPRCRELLGKWPQWFADELSPSSRAILETNGAYPLLV